MHTRDPYFSVSLRDTMGLKTFDQEIPCHKVGIEPGIFKKVLDSNPEYPKFEEVG